MLNHQITVPITLGLSLCVSTLTHALERLDVRTLPTDQLTQMLPVDQQGLLTLSPTDHKNWNLLQKNTTERHNTHVRIQQHYEGIPVYGAQVIIHRGGQLKNPHMNGALYQGLDEALGHPSTDYLQGAALALQKFKSAWPSADILEESVQTLIYIDQKNHAHWAYRVSVFVQSEKENIQRPTAILEAISFKPLQQWNDLKTLHIPVHALGYGGNAHTGIYQYGQNLPLLDIVRDTVLELCYMENNLVRVVNLEGRYPRLAVNVPMSFPCTSNTPNLSPVYWSGLKNNGYDEINGAFSPSNDALYIGGQIKDMYKKWYHVDVLSAHHKPMTLIMRVHYGQSYANAFWDGKQMTFGDGRWDMYPLVTLDVGAHEVSHGFTEQHSNLDYYDQSGGMNESFSDMAGQVAEYYVRGVAPWTIGADLFKENSNYHVLRYMDEPHRDGHSIEHLSQYHKDLDVHYLSGLYNRLFYLLSTTPGWDIRQAFELMLNANMNYWTPTSTFQEGACGLLDASDELGFSQPDVEQALTKVGLAC